MYCPIDKHKLKYREKTKPTYLECPNCGIFYSSKRSDGKEVSQEDLIQEAFDLVKNEGKELRERGYGEKTSRILLLSKTNNLKRKLNLPYLSAQGEPKVLDFKKESEKIRRKNITKKILENTKSF